MVELVARRARPSMTHDIIGSTLPSSVFNGPRAKFNFFGCNRSNLSDTSYYFSTKLYTGAFFSLSLSLFPPRSNCRDPDPGKKLLKFRFLSDLSPRKFNRILFRFERFTCDTSVQICDRAAGWFFRWTISTISHLSFFYSVIWNSWNGSLLSNKNLV